MRANEKRFWNLVGIIGNIVVLIITILVVIILIKFGMDAMFFPATAAYKFMHQDGGLWSIVASIIASLAFIVTLWALIIAEESAERLLKFVTRRVKRIICMKKN